MFIKCPESKKKKNGCFINFLQETKGTFPNPDPFGLELGIPLKPTSRKKKIYRIHIELIVSHFLNI